MRLLTLKYKIVIGVVLFVLLLCAGYYATTFHTSTSNNNYSSEVGQIEYKGQLLIPVENFVKVTSKYGTRIHPISR